MTRVQHSSAAETLKSLVTFRVGLSEAQDWTCVCLKKGFTKKSLENQQKYLWRYFYVSSRMKRGEATNCVLRTEASCLVKGFEQLESSKLGRVNDLLKQLRSGLL